MNMSDLKTKLTNFLSGDLATETDAMLTSMGYVKADSIKPETPVDAEAIKAEAVKAGREAAMKDVSDILDMCALAGTMAKATDLIQSGASVETIRKQLVDAKAEEAKGTEIKNNVSPLNTGEVNPVIADAMRRAGK